MSDLKPENLKYTLKLTQAQVSEAVVRHLKILGTIPDDSSEAYVTYYDPTGCYAGMSQIDVRAEVEVKVHDAKALVNILKDDEED